MNLNEKFDLVTRNLKEVLGMNELKESLKKKDFSVYWGTMPTGSVSLAYFFPMLKISDFLRAGLKVKILIADLHAALDGVSWKLLDKRFEYYRRAILLILRVIGADSRKLEFIRGKDIQLNKNYFEDLLKLSTISSVRVCKKAASEAVKSAQGEQVRLSGLIYPLMQALDEEYLGVDAQFAGLDQRKILVYARDYLPRIGYRSRIELMNPMIRGLSGGKMSSSVESSKIGLLDSEEKVISKVKKAYFVEGDVENGIMDFLRYVIMTLKEDRGESFVVQRSKKYGGNAEFSNYGEIEEAVLSKRIHPLDLKNAVAQEINKLLKGIRNDKELNKLYKEAYQNESS